MSAPAWRGAVALVAALLVSLWAADVAHARSDRQLLRRHQPVTVFDPAEAFQPASVRPFVRDSNLERFEGGAWLVVDEDPRPSTLPGPGTGTWRLNQDSCTPTLPIGGLQCYDQADEVRRSVVYGRVARPTGAIVLQYWFFYYDNVYSYAYPANDFIWQAHEGDWEVVNVVLSEDEDPLYVGYSQHCRGQRRDWILTPRVGDHPVVHVAVGSHANYFASGAHPINLACIPPQAIAILRALGLPNPVDYAGEGDVAGPPGDGRIRTHIRRVGDDQPAWVTFPGRFGELQYFHGPPPIGTVPLGASPEGPAYHAVWTNPLGTLAGWPNG